MKAWKNHIALILVNLIYAINYLVAKEVMPSVIGPYGFILLRVLVCALLFTLIALYRNILYVERKDWLRIILCALCGVVINQLFFFKGLSLTTPIHASLLMIVTPILVYILSVTFTKEQPKAVQFVGILIASAGAVLLITEHGMVTFSSETFIGDVYIALNAAAYAAYLLMVKPLMKKYHPLTIITYVFLIGLLPVTFAGAGELYQVQWQSILFIEWICIIFVVLMVTFVAYLLNIYALQSGSAILAGAYIYIQPVLAAILAVLFGKDHISWYKVLAAILIFSGVFLVSFIRKNKWEATKT